VVGQDRLQLLHAHRLEGRGIARGLVVVGDHRRDRGEGARSSPGRRFQVRTTILSPAPRQCIDGRIERTHEGTRAHMRARGVTHARSDGFCVRWFGSFLAANRGMCETRQRWSQYIGQYIGRNRRNEAEERRARRLGKRAAVRFTATLVSCRPGESRDEGGQEAGGQRQ
jgi:hypothetical protein